MIESEKFLKKIKEKENEMATFEALLLDFSFMEIRFTIRF